MSEINLNNLAVIENFPLYRINTDGHVYDTRTGGIVEPVSDSSVMIDGVLRSIDILLAETYIGKGDYDVVPGRTTINSSRQQMLTYLISSIEYDDALEAYIMNDHIPFVTIPLKDDRYIISMDGVIYDTFKKDFVHRSWKNGRVMAILYGEPLSVAACVYMAYIGKIPKGMYIKFKDGNMYNVSHDNLELQSLSEIRRAAKNQRGNAYDANIIRQVCEVLTTSTSSNVNEDIAKLLNLPYETRADKHRIASFINKLKTRPGYYDDLKKEFGFME